MKRFRTFWKSASRTVKYDIFLTAWDIAWLVLNILTHNVVGTVLFSVLTVAMIVLVRYQHKSEIERAGMERRMRVLRDRAEAYRVAEAIKTSER